MTQEGSTSNWSEGPGGTTSNEDDHVLSRISPPLLRRQRSNVASDEARPGAIPSRLRPSRGEDLRRHSSVQNSYLSISSGLCSGSEPHGHRHSAPYPGIPSHASKSANGFLDPKRPSTSATNGKPKCQVCTRGSFTNYDPLITCSGCRKHYHDSCRKPSLAEGADAPQWRCFRCLSDGARRFSKPRATDTPVSRAAPILSEKNERGANTANVPPKFRDPVQVDFPPANTLKIDRSNHESNVPLPNRSLERSGGSAALRLSNGPQAMSDSYSSGVSDNGTHAKMPQPNSASQESLNGLQRKRSLQDLYETSRPRDAGRHNQSQAFHGLAKIPNTPSQTSNQTNTQSPTVVAGADVLEDLRALQLGFTPLEPIPSAKPLLRTSLCTVCLKQHVLPKSGATKVICRKCLEHSRNAQHERTEIPETPEPAVHALLLETENLPSPSNPEARLQTEEDRAPLPWFNSGLVSAAPKIKRKKARLDDVQGNGVVAQGSPGTLSTEIRQQPADPDNSIQGDNEGEATRMSSSPDQVSPVEARQPSSVASRAFVTENLMSPVREHATTVVSSRPSWSGPDPLGSRDGLSPEGGPQDARQLAVQKAYTVRELAQIALVAANGKSLTVSDAVSWITSTLPEESLIGAWAKSIEPVFSRFDEFDGDKLVGREIRYGFSSKETRRTYEQRFSAFLPLPSPTTRFEAGLDREVSRQSGDRVRQKPRPRAVKTAERPQRSQSEQERMVHDSNVERHDPSAEDTDEGVCSLAKFPLGSDQPELKQAKIEERKNDLTFNHFQREGSPPKFLVPQDHNMHIRLNSFKELRASIVPPSIDSMTEEEIGQKIAEIKARPSRKKFFGQENKLAHKRRHKLVDIHDERDGAWQNPRAKTLTTLPDTDRTSDTSLNMDVDVNEPQTLRQLFNLPDNIIPMNDGHTELAFRDGTLVNGRLPRPRNVYRVGKMCGGELTVRST